MQKIEKKQFVMSIAVVALAIAFVFLQYLPLDKETKGLKAANTKLLAENTAAGVHLEVLPQMYKEIENIKEQVGDFDAKIPVSRLHGLFLQNLTSVMQKHGLGELVVQPGTERETDSLSQIPVYIRCKGKLVQIFKFFKALENFERIIQIEEVGLTANDKFDGSVTMQAKVNIFYRTN
jgi:Tfp pilus assembly protein PilO